MTRRSVLLRWALGLGAVAAFWIARRSGRPAGPPGPPAGTRGGLGVGPRAGWSGVDRLIMVCVNKYGDYSPGIYIHGGPDGESGLRLAREAAPMMRDLEAGDAAAGLCGYLFKTFGDDAASGGGLSLYDEPRPGPDGVVDWQSYCGGNVDLVLVHIDEGYAEAFSSPFDRKGPKISIGRVDGLSIGDKKPR